MTIGLTVLIGYLFGVVLNFFVLYPLCLKVNDEKHTGFDNLFGVLFIPLAPQLTMIVFIIMCLLEKVKCSNPFTGSKDGFLEVIKSFYIWYMERIGLK
jgi:hypothetical protein